MTLSDNLLKSFSKSLKQLTKMNAFLLFLRFHENRIIVHCFHHRYDKISRNCAFYGNSINIHLLGYFCMQNSYLR